MSLTNSNTINTRIQLKYDTYANWLASTLEILPGEMCVALASLGSGESAGDTLTEGSGASAHQVAYKPTILIKIGDGIKVTDSVTGQQRYKYFNELDYVQTKAGDVYAWAKAPIAPDASELYMDNSNANKVTIAQQIASITASVSGANTNTVFRIAYNATTRQIRLEKQDGTNPSAAWEVVALPTAEQYGQTTDTNNVGGWISLGASTALDDSVVISGNTIGVQISSASGNALTLNETTDTEGLYVPNTEFTAASQATSTAGQETVNVLSGIASTINPNKFTTNFVNVYTKEKVDALLNPSMQFKGVITAAQADAKTLTEADLGDSYKLADNGTNSLLTVLLKTARAGDLIIACKTETEDELTHEVTTTYHWSLIPSGDESVVDTYRPVAINGTEVVGGSTLTGYLNLKTGTGVTMSATNQDGNGLDTKVTVNGDDFPATELTIGIDTNTIATKASVTALETHTGGLGSYTDGGGNTVNHTVKSYVDNAVSAIDVANLTQTSTYLILNCGDAAGWDSYAAQAGT